MRQENFFDREMELVEAFKVLAMQKNLAYWAIEVWQGGAALWFMQNQKAILVSVFPTEEITPEMLIEKVKRIVQSSGYSWQKSKTEWIVDDENYNSIVAGLFPPGNAKEWLRRIRMEEASS